MPTTMYGAKGGGGAYIPTTVGIENEIVHDIAQGDLDTCQEKICK